MANFPAYNPYQPMMYGQQMSQPYPTYPAQMPTYQPTMQQPMMQQGVQPSVQQPVQPTVPQQAQQQPVQQQTALPGIRGRVVSAASEIMPNEVPMDGMPSFFPQQDMSCIYVKVWDSEGKLKPTRYVREPDAPVQQTIQPDSNAAFAGIAERLDRIESSISSLIAAPRRPVPANKKERVSEDE